MSNTRRDWLQQRTLVLQELMSTNDERPFEIDWTPNKCTIKRAGWQFHFTSKDKSKSGNDTTIWLTNLSSKKTVKLFCEETVFDLKVFIDYARTIFRVIDNFYNYYLVNSELDVEISDSDSAYIKRDGVVVSKVAFFINTDKKEIYFKQLTVKDEVILHLSKGFSLSNIKENDEIHKNPYASISTYLKTNPLLI